MELVPAFVNWGKELDHLVQVLLPHALGSAQRERWNIDVLLRLLKELFPFVCKKAIDTCPFPLVSDDERLVFSTSVLEHAYGLYCSTSVLEQFAGFRPAGGTLPDTHHATKTAVAEKLAAICVLPLLLASVLGSPRKYELLTEYLRNLLIQTYGRELDSEARDFLFCSLSLVPCIDAKVASTHVLPALVTLGSDHNLNVKYVSIDAFGAVAQQFKNDAIVDKICIQMDAFLEDGSHEATLAVVRALASLMKPDLRENNALESETGRMCGDHEIDDGGNEIDELDLT
ncbi:hypothetical protein CQW23_01626 [Capsicum baccatum]|uniref:Uncharacterized protein n=1 Tax=Capsicum baccatum TaxID=33114 RepID=A0A2G2XP33_CAPBA|nr:hypothetical protein CQW23_01626 [Capsicum baccatum]